MTVTDWISAMAHVVAALGLVFVWRQFKLSGSALEADHQRSRKEFAITVMREWQRSREPKGSAANRLVSTWDDEQCRNLVSILPVKIKPDQQELVEDCLGRTLKNPAPQNDGFIHLDKTEVQTIRFHGVNYLNSIETALSAWQLHIADRDTIAIQFGFLYRPEEGHNTLETLRTAFGRPDSYPAIEEFIKELANKRESGAPVSQGPIA